MRPSQPAADRQPKKTGRSPTRELIVRIVPAADAADPAQAFQDFVATIGDLLLADWVADHARILAEKNLTLASTRANTPRPNSPDEGQP